MFGLDHNLEKFINQCLEANFEKGLRVGRESAMEAAREEVRVQTEKDQRNLRRFRKQLKCLKI
jgi:hypothetical protein